MSERAERQARRLLAAYPWRVRAEQGDEIVGTVLDVLPPGARRLPVRTAVDLVRGGWRVRSGRRPPWPTVLAYWMGLRISPRWLMWVYDDLEDPDYVRTKRRRTIAVWVPGAGLLAVLLGDPWIVFFGSAGIIGQTVFGIARDRERRRSQHGLAPGGSDPAVVWVRRRRKALVPNLSLTPLALGVGVALTAGAALCAAAMATSQADPWPWARVVAVLGAVGLGLVVLGAWTALAGRRRGRPVGLWEVVPRSGPHDRDGPVPLQHLHLWPDARRLSAEDLDDER